ncbi:flavin monoamine oxidase family protein [Desmospora profundinema]|uniref:Monoamine oxidase n=1 Tax=Desmospora profundinema TaxID=1571184 RepID=A0ABU1IMR0_9BACL|nr:flavin monoamine oxidase family protein [Desmospora profundinema]MDR6226077.1 monoamine oxidase [Desmospora profundinema]
MAIYKTFQLTDSQMISIIRRGLKKTQSPKKIIIVGAGMAGLVAASLLKDAGHHVEILEATERVGGRIFTIRSPFADGQYLDVGPMRIPHIHHLTLEYIRKFRLPINPFLNITPNDRIYVNGIKTLLKVYEQNPDILNFPVAPHEKGKTVDELIELATKPITDFVNRDPQRNWNVVVRELEAYSLDTFFIHNPVGPPLSRGAIEMIKVITGLEGISELSFTELLREYLLIGSGLVHFYEITGGLDRLPKAFLPQLETDIFFEQKITKIVQHDNQVTIHSVHPQTKKPFKNTGDLALITIPFSVLRTIEVEPYHSFSHGKRKSIRQLHYVPATKIGIQFKRRFWEEEGLYGGKTISDLPIRYTYYPSHGFGEPSGIVLASYTWEDDALIWDSMSEENQLQLALKNMAVIHGENIIPDFVTGVAHNWSQYPYSAGAFSMFKPEQETELFPNILKPEGRVYFAGEHASTTARSWIQGAIESGIRVAYEMNDLPSLLMGKG